MKKIVAMLLAAMMIVSAFAGCKNSSQSDSDYVKEKGKLIIGITDFAPMDYKDDSGNWIGFDADMANKFAESLGVKAEFVEIKWDNKIPELKNKSIDCVWNGMTLDDEVKKGMQTSNPYCKNAQVVVVKSDVADKYTTEDSIKKLNFAVEAGSAGEEALKAIGITPTALGTQADALKEVAAGTSDACVIDLLMAGAMIGEGTSYENLTYTVKLTSEDYGVGFRTGSDLAEKLNEFFKSAYSDGSMLETAKKYGVQETVIEQK